MNNIKIISTCFFCLLLITLPIKVSQAKRGYKVGDTAPGFTLKDLNGKKHSLTGLRQQGPVLLIFWAVECVYCYAHVKEFNQATETYKGRLTIAAINIEGEQDEQVKEYAKDNSIQYLLLSDRLNNIDVAESYRVLGTPTIVLVSVSGKILFYGHQMPNLKKLFK